jgi:hypothetical protein
LERLRLVVECLYLYHREGDGTWGSRVQVASIDILSNPMVMMTFLVCFVAIRMVVGASVDNIEE